MPRHPRLSLLVLTVPRRVRTYFPRLVGSLCAQADDYKGQVEVLALFDNRTRTIGTKRNALLDLAVGDYVAFIDDDDRVAMDFVRQVLVALDAHPGVDLVLYDAVVERPGRPDCLCRYDVTMEKPVFDPEPWRNYLGPPAHHHVWRAGLAKQFRFPDRNTGEDFAWTLAARTRVATWCYVHKSLYFYNYNILTSESARRD